MVLTSLNQYWSVECVTFVNSNKTSSCLKLHAAPFISVHVSLFAGPDVYRGREQQKGMGMVPKRAVDVMSCQIARFMQLTQNSIIPISYHVQRKVTLPPSLLSLPPSLHLPLSPSLPPLLPPSLPSITHPVFLCATPSPSHSTTCCFSSLCAFSLLQSLREFHGDLFPDTVGGEPALSAEQWCHGDNAKVIVCVFAECLVKKEKKSRLTWPNSN